MTDRRRIRVRHGRFTVLLGHGLLGAGLFGAGLLAPGWRQARWRRPGMCCSFGASRPGGLGAP